MPYYDRDPKRDHNFENHPHECESVWDGSMTMWDSPKIFRVSLSAWGMCSKDYSISVLHGNSPAFGNYHMVLVAGCGLYFLLETRNQVVPPSSNLS